MSSDLGKSVDELCREDGSRVVKIVDNSEDVLQSEGMKRYFSANNAKTKHASKRKQKVL